jgi:hypothetical protein
MEIKKVLSRTNFLKEDVVLIMKKYLPSFQHLETGKTLDSKM